MYLDTYWHGLRFLRALILLNLGDVLVYLRVINTSSSIRLTKLATIVTCTVSSKYIYTLAKTEIIYPKNVRAKVAMDFTYDKINIRHPGQLKK